MEELYKQLEKLEEKVTKELEKINVKPDMSPTDLKAATDALCLIEKIDKIQNEDFGEEYSERNSHGRFSGSYGRMRSPRTGQYMGVDNGYSRHSINDRIVDKLERMMDEAGSDYEREVISTWIRKIESE